MGKYFYELRQYTRQYQNLQEQKTVVRNQLHALKHTMCQYKQMIKQQEATIKLFDKQLLQLADFIKKDMASYQIVKNNLENIC